MWKCLHTALHRLQERKYGKTHNSEILLNLLYSLVSRCGMDGAWFIWVHSWTFGYKIPETRERWWPKMLSLIKWREMSFWGSGSKNRWSLTRRDLRRESGRPEKPRDWQGHAEKVRQKIFLVAGKGSGLLGSQFWNIHCGSPVLCSQPYYPSVTSKALV